MHETIPQHIQRIALPDLSVPAGPLHTILLDEGSRIYYTDEFNDTVVCLDCEGRVRWCRNAPRSEAAGFFYPRGMDIGWFLQGGRTIRCLAVCDAWKHRVQVLDLEGNSLALWTLGGAIPFSEVSDLRYISRSSAGQDGYWLVLDGGNHRICALAQDGKPIFEVGRCLTPTLGKGWVAPGIELEEDELPAGMVRDFPRFDFLYYPSRILGNCEHALYVWGPASRELKQMLFGNLFPISVRPDFPSVEWIGADVTGLLGYCKETGGLSLYNNEGDLWRETHMKDGAPIASNLGLHEFWVQTGGQIDRWSWRAGSAAELMRPEPDRIRACGPLLRTAIDLMCIRDSDTTAIGEVTSVLNRIIALADEFICGIQKGNWAQDLLNRVTEMLPKLAQERINAVSTAHGGLHHWCVGMMGSRLLLNANSGAVRAAREKWQALIAPVHAKFAEVQQRLDDFARIRWTLPGTVLADPQAPGKLTNVIEDMETELLECREWLYRWSGIVESTTPVFSLADAGLEADRAVSILSFPRKVQRHKPTSSCIKEVAILSVSAAGNVAPLQPHSLVMTQEGDLLVSLANDNRVIRMNRSGKLLDSIGRAGTRPGEFQRPTGLTLDALNRLWVADRANHRVQIFSGTRDAVQVIDSSNTGLGGFNLPMGLSRQLDGSVLVADYGNHRVLRISQEGACSVFTDRIGRDPDANWYPISFATDRDGSVWLVDFGNHRVKKLSSAGTHLQTIGGCGLWKGCLYLPVSAGVFDDGVLAVAQVKLDQCLKLFSPSGDELAHLPLDYYPSGMVISGRTLFVAAYDDNSIRVYEREQMISGAGSPHP